MRTLSRLFAVAMSLTLAISADAMQRRQANRDRARPALSDAQLKC